MYSNINSLGLTPIDDYSDQPWLGAGTGTTTTPTTTKRSVTDVIKDWFGVAKEGVDIYNTYKSGETNQDATVIMQHTPPPPPEQGTKKLLKYGLYAAGAGLLAYGGYLVLSQKKKK